jgi:hypothetical protein
MAAIDVVATRARRIARELPDGARVRIHGSLPPGHGLDLPAALPNSLAEFARSRMAPALAELELALPLRRDPDSDVWEGLVLDVFDGRPWLVARNLLGEGERLHVFAIDRSRAAIAALPLWFASRETPCEDTSWDAARVGRVVLTEENFGSSPSYIDPGAVRIIEIALALGATTLFTCEGHPSGGYVVVKDDPAGARLVETLATLGWETHRWHKGLTAQMPRPADLAERDARWRWTCTGLELAFRLAPDAGRDELARANLHPSQAENAPPGPRP